jgi:hypothetical protein
MLESKKLVVAPVPGRKLSSSKTPNSKILCSFSLFKNLLEKNGAKKAIAEKGNISSIQKRILRPSYLNSDRRKLASGHFMLASETRMRKSESVSVNPKKKEDVNVFVDFDDFEEPEVYRWKRPLLDD